MEIDLLNKTYSDFDKVFNSLYTGIKPLFSLVDDMARMMEISEKDYFILPAFKSNDKQPHIFYFTVRYDKYDKVAKFVFTHAE